MNKKLIIFDFDGVLANTLDLAFVLQKKYNPTLTKDFFHSLSDGNFHENYKKAMSEGKINDIPEWEEEYSKVLLELNSEEMIQKLVVDLDKKYMLAVVSSTMSFHIEKFLTREKIEHCFVDILGADVHTSKVVKIKKLLEKYSIRADEAVFVTDTLGDIKEGNECGVRSIGVTWGAHNQSILEQGKPFAIVDTVLELEKSISEFFNSK